MPPSAIETIIVGTILAVVGLILKAPAMRWIHVRTLRKLEDAENELQLGASSWGSSKIIEVQPIRFSFSLSQIAKRAGIPLWQAKWARNWKREQELYTKISGK
jgi:hypothetical protein